MIDLLAVLLFMVLYAVIAIIAFPFIAILFLFNLTMQLLFDEYPYEDFNRF